jgi:hypothetical protein
MRKRRVLLAVAAIVALVAAVAVVVVMATDDGSRPDARPITGPVSTTAPAERSQAMLPDVGPTDSGSLFTVVNASGPLDNQEPAAVAAGRAPAASPCIDVLARFASPDAVLVHEAKTEYEGEDAKVLVYRTRDGRITGMNVFIEGSGQRASGGCDLLTQAVGGD